jgi:hypothetical protein
MEFEVLSQFSKKLSIFSSFISRHCSWWSGMKVWRHGGVLERERENLYKT